MSMSLGRSAKKRFLWLHDLVPVMDLLSARHLVRMAVYRVMAWLFGSNLLCVQIDGIFVQSKFHASSFANELPWKLKSPFSFTVIRNGLSDLSACNGRENDNTVFVYARLVLLLCV